MYDVAVGVPYTNCDDDLKKFNEIIYATREDEALAICCGYYLCGKKAFGFMQNSGLGNCIDIITSLIRPYGINIDWYIAYRDSPEHHALMGKIQQRLLGLLDE